MTQVNNAKRNFAPGTSRTRNDRRMFAVQMAMEIERLGDMAGRIRELRGPRPQPVVASSIGVGLRTYQNWEEAANAPEWDNLEKLADYHGVSANYILYGEEEPVGPQSQLDRIEADVREALGLLRRLAAVDPPEMPAELGRYSTDPQTSAPERPRKQRRGAAGSQRGTA